MKRPLNKLLIISSLILTLSACGGGDEGEESSNNNSNYVPPNTSTVSGQFYHSTDTEKFFSTEDFPSYEQYGQNARHCYQSYNDYYFESEKTMVFGNPDLPESDFKQAATGYTKKVTQTSLIQQSLIAGLTNNKMIGQQKPLKT